MTQHDQSNPPADDAAGRAYEVGYGRPPLHTRVKPGQVLNPRGRPKGQRNAATVLSKALNERTKIREGNRTRSVSKFEALVLTMIHDACRGNAKAQTTLFNQIRAAGLVGSADQPKHQEPFTADDEAVIADFLARYEGAPETESSDDEGAPEASKKGTKS